MISILISSQMIVFGAAGKAAIKIGSGSPNLFLIAPPILAPTTLLVWHQEKKVFLPLPNSNLECDE